MAALQAKKDGDIEHAKEYLRKAKVIKCLSYSHTFVVEIIFCFVFCYQFREVL